MRKDLAKSSLFSLLSLLIPLVLGLVIIPQLIQSLGKERFSYLSLVWSLLGYFSFLDLGIGRTLTKMVAEKINKQGSENDLSFVKTAQVFVLFVSVVGTLVVYFLANVLVEKYLTVSTDIQEDLISSSKIIAFGIPMVTLASLNRGVLEGFSDFKLANIIQILSGILLFVLPLVFWKISPSMVFVCLGILLGRAILLFLSWKFVSLRLSHFSKAAKLNYSKDLKNLLSHGGWITVGNILAPLMANLDKILLGGIVALEKVVFYTTPMEMISRIWAVPGSVTRIFFPKFASNNNDQELKLQFRFASQIMGLFVVPICLVIYVFSHELMSLWLNKDFAMQSYSLAQWMVLGVLFNCFNWIPYGWLQATSYVRWSIYTVLLEIPLFFSAFFFFTNAYGISGAAAVWAARLVFDFVITYLVVVKVKRSLMSEFVFAFGYILGTIVTALILSFVQNLALKISLSLIIILAFALMNKNLIGEMLPKLRSKGK